MNYSELISLALNYVGRPNDAFLTPHLDSFLRLTEARANRLLKVQKMGQRSYTTTDIYNEYISLPVDFKGLRDIEVRENDGSTKRHTPSYLSPEQMNMVADNPNSNIYYTIIADQLQIHPKQDAQLLEIVYYKKIPELTATATTNWLLDDHPDVYLSGFMMEITAFESDEQAHVKWAVRFKGSMAEVNKEDVDMRWSGPALVIRSL